MATGALQNTSFYEASLIDRIPAGIDDVRLESIQCVILTSPVQPCGSIPGTTLTPVPSPTAPRCTAGRWAT